MPARERARSDSRRWAAGFSLAAAIATGTALPCHGVEWDTDPQAAAADPDYAAGRKAIEAKDWNAAIKFFSSAALRAPDNADIHVGTRTVLEYLLSPVQKVAHEAGRER